LEELLKPLSSDGMCSKESMLGCPIAQSLRKITRTYDSVQFTVCTFTVCTFTVCIFTACRFTVYIHCVQIHCVQIHCVQIHCVQIHCVLLIVTTV
jgi:hypothetical protein